MLERLSDSVEGFQVRDPDRFIRPARESCALFCQNPLPRIPLPR